MNATVASPDNCHFTLLIADTNFNKRQDAQSLQQRQWGRFAGATP
jgi:hypothetical protein